MAQNMSVRTQTGAGTQMPVRTQVPVRSQASTGTQASAGTRASVRTQAAHDSTISQVPARTQMPVRTQAARDARISQVIGAADEQFHSATSPGSYDREPHLQSSYKMKINESELEISTRKAELVMIPMVLRHVPTDLSIEGKPTFNRRPGCMHVRGPTSKLIFEHDIREIRENSSLDTTFYLLISLTGVNLSKRTILVSSNPQCIFFKPNLIHLEELGYEQTDVTSCLVLKFDLLDFGPVDCVTVSLEWFI